MSDEREMETECRACGQTIYGGDGGWHTVDGKEVCYDGSASPPFHEPALPGFPEGSET